MIFVTIPFILIFIFGYLLTLVFIKKFSFVGRIGLSYLLGLGLFTFIIFCYSNLGIKITTVSIILSLTILNTLLVLLIRIKKIKFKDSFINILKIFKDVPVFELFIAAIILFMGFLSLFQTLYYPVTVWDALALYDFRSKIIAEYGFFTQVAKNYFYFSQYPLLTSLGHTIVYLFGGLYPQFIYSLMYLSFLFVFYGSLREFCARRITLLSTLIMASVPVFFEHSTFAYTNLPYAIYISLSTILIYIWIVKNKSIGYLIVCGLFTALSTWSRSSEPFWAINLLVIFIFSIIKGRNWLKNISIFLFTFYPIRWIWQKVYISIVNEKISNNDLIVSEINNISTTLFRHRINFNKLIEVTSFLYNNVIKTWYPIFFVFVFFVIINLIRFINNKITIFILLFIFHFLLLVYGTYIYSFGISYWADIPDSARRMAIFFFPLMIFYIGIMLTELLKDKVNK